MTVYVLLGWALVSVPTLVFLSVAYVLTRHENDRLRRTNMQLMETKHGGAFHRCTQHDSIGISAMDERAADLTDIRKRWESHHRNRTD